MRQSIVDGIEQVYKDATAKGDTNMEVLRARGSESSLNDRLDKNDTTHKETTAQLAQTFKVNDTGVLDLNVFNETARNVLQGQEPGTINAVLGKGNVKPENTDFFNMTGNILKIQLAEWKKGFSINATGVVVSVNQEVAEYIDISGKTTLYYGGSTTFDKHSIFYNADKNIISIVANNTRPFIVPPNAKYISVVRATTSNYSVPPYLIASNVADDVSGHKVYSQFKDTDNYVFDVASKVDMDKFKSEVELKLKDVSNSKENSIYSWWVYPIAIRYKGIRDKTYIGFTDNEGYQGVMSYDNKTGVIEKTTLRKDIVDDHNAFSVRNLPDGRLMVIGAGHASTNYNSLFISTKPESVKEFSEEIKLMLPTGYKGVSYAQVIASNIGYHLFFRLNDTANNFYWGYRFSSNGTDWSEMKPFITCGSVQYYLKAMRFDGNKIKFVCGSNPVLAETDVRIGYIDVNTHDITTLSGSILGNMNTLTSAIDFSLFDIIIPKPANLKQRIIDLSEGTDTAIAFTRMAYYNDPNYTSHIAYLNEVTKEVTIVNLPYQGVAFGPNYQNGIVFVDAHTIIMSRNTGTGWVMEKYTNVGTGDFVLSETLESTPQSIKMMRPQIAVRDGSQVIWNRGVYNSINYTDFNVDIDGNFF